MLYFANGMKTKVNLLPAETTSDLLDRDEVKVNFSSSASYLWMVDHHGDGGWSQHYIIYIVVCLLLED